jgi:hypothetical protein
VAGAGLAIVGGGLVIFGPGPPSSGQPGLQPGHHLAIPSGLRLPSTTTTSTAFGPSSTTSSSTSSTTSTTQKPGASTTTSSKPQTTITTTVTSHFELTVSPAHFNQTCGANLEVGATTVTLDNTKSTAPATWTTSVQRLNNNQPWAQLSPSSGTVPAGQKATFQLTPRNPDTCGSIPSGQSRDFHVTINVQWPGDPSSQQTTLTDTVSRPQ